MINKQVTLKVTDLQAGRALPIDISELTIYDLQAKVFYELHDVEDNIVPDTYFQLPASEYTITQTGQVREVLLHTSAVQTLRDLIDRFSGRAALDTVVLRIDASITPDVTTPVLPNGVTKPALEAAFLRRDLQDLSILEANEIPTNSIGEQHLQSGAVTHSKIADGAVTHTKIAEGAVHANDIEDRAVSSDKLAREAVGTEQLADEAITAEKIADNSITLDKLDPAARRQVTGRESVPLATGQVTTEKLADLAVTEDKIANGAVTAEKLSDDSVSTEKIADQAVTGDKVQLGTLTADHFRTVPSLAIEPESIVGDMLAPRSVTREKIADGVLYEPTVTDIQDISDLDLTIANPEGLSVGTAVATYYDRGTLTGRAVNLARLASYIAVNRSATPLQFFHGIIRSRDLQHQTAQIACIPGSIVGRDEDGYRITDHAGSPLIPGQKYAITATGQWVASNGAAIAVAASTYALRIALVPSFELLGQQLEPLVAPLTIGGVPNVSAPKGGSVVINPTVAGGTTPYSYKLFYADGSTVATGTSSPSSNLAFDSATRTIWVGTGAFEDTGSQYQLRLEVIDSTGKTATSSEFRLTIS